MNKDKLILKIKWGRCIVCRTKVSKKDFYYCDIGSCPLGELCEDCANLHKKGHLLENSVNEECDLLLNSLNGTFQLNKGNNTGLF